METADFIDWWEGEDNSTTLSHGVSFMTQFWVARVESARRQSYQQGPPVLGAACEKACFRGSGIEWCGTVLQPCPDLPFPALLSPAQPCPALASLAMPCRSQCTWFCFDFRVRLRPYLQLLPQSAGVSHVR